MTGDTDLMLQMATWSARAAGLGLVGLLTFLSPPSAHDRLTTQIVAYAVLCVAVAAWAVIDLSPQVPERFARLALPAVLSLMTVAAAAGGTAGGNGNVLIVFGAVAMLAAGESASPSTALAVGAVGVLAIEIGGIAFNQGVGDLVGYPLLLVVGLLAGRYRSAYRIQAEQSALLLAQHERLRAEQRRADVLDERTRIAREIHDVLAHSLGALGIQIQSARALLTDRGDVERALESLATAQRMAADGLAETRRAVHALRTDTLPLHEEVARAAEEHAERHKVAVRCETGGTPLPVPPDATVALLRAAQEALVNAAKHAPGQTVDIRLDYRDQGIRLTVANELHEAGGIPAHAVSAMSTVDGGYGLTGMRERLRLLRGSLEAGPHAHRWIVTADLPLVTAPPAPTAPEKA